MAMKFIEKYLKPESKLSLYSLVVCILFVTYTAFVFYPKWNKQNTEATISWDVAGYYSYLPAFLIYKDFKKVGWIDSIGAKYQPASYFQVGFIDQVSGNYVMKYSSGQSITMLPFFIIAHTWAKNSELYPPDGFSYPYQVSIGIGMFLYGLLGLLLFRYLLLHFFNDKTVAIVIAIFVFGTNYINYIAIDQAMTHNTLFLIYVLLLLATMKFYEKPSITNGILIGLCCGMAALIRPTEIISVLIPILWGLRYVSESKSRLHFLTINKYAVLSAIFTIAVIGSIQLIYWQVVANQWLVYSYQDQGFSWLSPHIYDYTMSYKCGWLRYCPMMVLPFVGLFTFTHKTENRILLITFIVLSFYIVTAWDVWDYGGTAGRAMVQYYPILAFPLASLIEWVKDKKWATMLFYFLVLLCAYLNIWWVYHAHAGNVRVLDLSRAYYKAKVGRWSSDEEDTKLLDNKHVYRGAIVNEKTLLNVDFNADTIAKVDPNDTNNKLLVLNKDIQFTPEFELKNDGTFGKWLRASAKFITTDKEWDVWKQSQFIIKWYNNEKELRSNMIRVYRFVNGNEQKDIYLDAKVPDQWTHAKVLVWHSSSDKTLYIDNLKVITFDE